MSRGFTIRFGDNSIPQETQPCNSSDMLTLFPNPESIAAFNDALNDSTKQQSLENITLCTSNDPDHEFDATGWDQENPPESKLTDDYRAAIDSIHKLRSLQAIEIKFTSEVGEPNDNIMLERYVPETWQFRFEALDLIFKALDRAIANGADITSLTIKNLQDMSFPSPGEGRVGICGGVPTWVRDLETVPAFHRSKAFENVMSHISSLHLLIATEFDEAAPENGISKEQLAKFFTQDLRSTWLEPVRENLKHLTIHCDNFWGLIPRTNLDGLHFPKLESLVLGDLSFTGHGPVDWILSHKTTLKRLILDDCGIVYKMMIAPDMMEQHQPDVTNLKHVHIRDSASGYRDYCYKCSLRWSDIFDRLRQELPQLQQFSLGRVEEYERANFDHRYELETEADAPLLYLNFNGGIGPSQWLRAGEDGKEEDDWELEEVAWMRGIPEEDVPEDAVALSPTKTHRERDVAALKRLLALVDSRQGKETLQRELSPRL